MNTFFIVIYLVSFCLIAGGAAAMMYANIQSIWNTPPAPPKTDFTLETATAGSKDKVSEFDDLFNE